MDQHHGKPMSSSLYDERPPSYSECIELPTLTPTSIKPTSSIPTAPVYSQDLYPPSSALPPNAAYVSVPYPIQQPTPINGLPSCDVVTRPSTWTPVSVPRTKDYMIPGSLFLITNQIVRKRRRPGERGHYVTHSAYPEQDFTPRTPIHCVYSHINIFFSHKRNGFYSLE
ncbi:hypothetical protein GDO81_014606 [Engystomops pustulosus]|uniref:Uncharacterized protein n=1 Tax=Engystomops pustulosus TaxID=76066 RepID=A0AAV7BBW9_ENGPU|nr:hypothetical protein GDO81_014606 [Engystomops pustulosus]